MNHCTNCTDLEGKKPLYLPRERVRFISMFGANIPGYRAGYNIGWGDVDCSKDDPKYYHFPYPQLYCDDCSNLTSSTCRLEVPNILMDWLLAMSLCAVVALFVVLGRRGPEPRIQEGEKRVLLPDEEEGELP